MSLTAAAGLVPFFVCATHGTTSSMAFDPTPAIGDICRTNGVWLHVDAAMSGIAALTPEHRWVNDGLELADSYCTNPHKWMGVNFDCDLFWVADRVALVNALSILPEFLRTRPGDEGTVVDYRDWQVPLGRRFRALKLWSVLSGYGLSGLREHLRGHIALAGELAFLLWVARPSALLERGRRIASRWLALVLVSGVLWFFVQAEVMRPTPAYAEPSRNRPR